MRPLLVTLLLLGSACVAIPDGASPGTPEWLVGTWCPDRGSTRHAGMNVGARPRQYRADRTFSGFEENGSWRLESNVLTLDNEGNPVRNIYQIGPDGESIMTMVDQFGTRLGWHRCTDSE